MMWRNVYTRRNRDHPRFHGWRDLNRFQREMDFLLGGTRGPLNQTFPSLNAWMNDEGVVIRAELPGVNPESIEISITIKTMTISGKRIEEELPEGAKYLRRERRQGDFSRSMELPYQIDEDTVEANFNQGILEISVPRKPEEKPKKIKVLTE